MRLARVVCLLVGGGVAAWGQLWLVAPFGNRSADPQLDWLGESVAETVRESLRDYNLRAVSREERLDMLKRLSVRPNGPVSLATLVRVAEKTGANRLLYGEIFFTPAAPATPATPATPAAAEGGGGGEEAPSSGTLRVVARLLDPSIPLQLGEFVETGPLEELPSIQANLAWRILQAAKAPNLPPRREFRKGRVTVKVNALESYMRGLTAVTEEAQHRYFTQAARLDPTFAHPRYYLGQMHFRAENYREAVSWLDDIGPTFPEYLEARFMLGLSRFELSEFEESRRAFEDVAARITAPEVWNNLAAAQERLGLPQALENAQKALNARPGDPEYHFNVGYMLWRRGDFATAAERFRAVLDRLPGDADALYLLGRCLKKSGPRPGDIRTEGLLRLKDRYEEMR
jgi:tetratricopeptide (TPR) repeat protein